MKITKSFKEFTSEPQYKPTYNIYTPLPQNLNRATLQSQNQNPNTEIDRQKIHSRPNRILTTPRVQFTMPSSLISTLLISKSLHGSSAFKLQFTTKHTKYSIRLLRFNTNSEKTSLIPHSLQKDSSFG